MKTFNAFAKVVSVWIAVALVFDAVMIYSHFCNPELEHVVVSKIDKLIY